MLPKWWLRVKRGKAKNNLKLIQAQMLFFYSVFIKIQNNMQSFLIKSKTRLQIPHLPPSPKAHPEKISAKHPMLSFSNFSDKPLPHVQPLCRVWPWLYHMIGMMWQFVSTDRSFYRCSAVDSRE